LVEEKCHEAKDNKLNEKDLLSLLINMNKTLPDEEKMTDDELKYQVIKKQVLYYKENYLYIFFRVDI
jgi:hypothetical protein